MTKQRITKVVIICLTVLLLSPLGIQAQQEDWVDIQSRLTDGGWELVLGLPLNSPQQTQFLYDRGQAQRYNDSSFIFRYFDPVQNDAKLNDVSNRYQIDRGYLEQLIIRAFNNNEQIIREGNIEISAGSEPFWQSQPAPPPTAGTTYPCQRRMPDGRLVAHTCVMSVDGQPAPDQQPVAITTTYMPYWRVRLATQDPIELPPQGTNDGLYFHNTLPNQNILVSVGYYRPYPDDKWMNRGWVRVRPNETVRGYPGSTFNPTYAYFAKIENSTQELTSGQGYSYFWTRYASWEDESQSMSVEEASQKGFYERKAFDTVETRNIQPYVVDIPSRTQ
ncbi:hypothetical protein QUF64_03245 [Anaerolineales bacterium HSG6]|nr:hypothetical protein [Anaerolineales bacterium HSG6]MDM8531556.1 hypothetical protein [Anaerolineales bacterium HSG25]